MIFTATYHWARAKMLRRVAEKTPPPPKRDLLLQLASVHDKLARAIERRALIRRPRP